MFLHPMNGFESSSPPASSTFYMAGATAVGKTTLAIAVAEALGAEIVGCDAFQVYQGLPLLTAKPSADELARVPHHLIGEVPLTQTFDVAQYRELALKRIEEIHRRGRIALVVGGTGMYLRALTRGLADLPPADAQVRAQLEAQSSDELQMQLERLDPTAFSRIDLKNRRRLIRALEVCILTGKPFSSSQSNWNENFSHLRGVLLERSRPELYKRINQRVESMFASGVLAETAGAGEVGATAAQTLGLREIHAVLRGELQQQEAIQLIQQATRQYAKRQATWFRREPWLISIELSATATLEEQRTAVLEAFSKNSVS